MECVDFHAAKRGTRFEALEPIRQGVNEHFGAFQPQAAMGLTLRHDHGSHDFQAEIAFLGIESSPAFVRSPEGNGCAERLIRILKENLLWVRTFATVKELRQAPGVKPCEGSGADIIMIKTRTRRAMACNPQEVAVMTLSGVLVKGYIPHWSCASKRPVSKADHPMKKKKRTRRKPRTPKIILWDEWGLSDGGLVTCPEAARFKRRPSHEKEKKNPAQTQDPQNHPMG